MQTLGAVGSTARTADDTEIAFFWANDADGTYKPPGQLYEITKIVSGLRGLDVVENARLFALVALALGDAGVVAWDAKYATTIDLWRPVDAVRLAGSDNNGATSPDPTWEPLAEDPVTGATPRRRFRRTSRATRRSAPRTPRSCGCTSARTT